MNRGLLLLLGLVLLAGPTDAAPVDLQHDPAWQALLVRLTPTGTRLVPFSERRTFPFRQKPVVLGGVVRIVPGRGLSLEYEAPESRLVIIDGQGVLVRDLAGQRAAPADRRSQAATAALGAVLRFDPAELARQFDLAGDRVGDAWTLTLRPRDAALAGGLASIVVSGEGAHLAKIEIHAMARIEIRLGPAEDGVVFSPATLARCFR
jgi:hypothetical protein